jgi:SNF2 family DNA or RNA helicase
MSKLHGYQEIAVQHLHDNPRAGLFLEMGLGKTAVVLSALTPDHFPALVIAPKRVAETVWPKEKVKWRDDIKIELAIGPPAKRLAAISKAPWTDLTVIGRENIGDLGNQKGSRVVYNTIILDELSGFKSRGTRWKQAKALTQKADYVWGLTGTPAPNGLMDLWPQLYLLDNGERLGKFVTHFRDRYFRPGRQLRNGTIIEWIIREEAEQRIYEKIEDICMSMSAAGKLDLPPVSENWIEVPLPAKVMRVYNELKKKLVTDLDLIGDIRTAKNAAVLSSKLSQISAGFIYDDSEEREWGAKPVPTFLHNEKLKTVQEIIDGTGSPVLVYYRYDLGEKTRLLSEINGARTIDEKGVIDDWDKGRVPALVVHPQSVAHGMNFQYGGHTVLWATMPWSLEEYQQGNGRVARQGQEHPVVIHHMLSPDTVDHAIRERLKEKKSVQDALLDHLEAR